MVLKIRRSIDSFLKRKQVRLYLSAGGLTTKEAAFLAKVTYNYAYRLVKLWMDDGLLKKQGKGRNVLTYSEDGDNVKSVLEKLEACK